MTTFQAYLEAKRSVDDRALNDRVFQAFVDGLADLAETHEGPIRIVEIGGGIGSMVARLAERTVLPSAVQYKVIDLDQDSIGRARERLPTWLADAGYTVDRTQRGLVARSEGRDGVADDASNGVELEVVLETADAFATRNDCTAVDVVIGAAVFDLVNLERALSWVSLVLKPGGLVYAPLTFDGATGFTPPDSFDGRLERYYHRHMDDIRDEPGGSRAGRQLVGALEAEERPFEVCAVGGSDWVLRPHDRTAAVARDERTVIRHLLETIDDALEDYPADQLDPNARRRWLERRYNELEAGELTVLAHHLDVLGRVQPTD